MSVELNLHALNRDVVFGNPGAMIRGWGSEIASWAARALFTDLDGPVHRIATHRVPIPVGVPLEDAVLWNLPMLWWARIGKLLQFAGGIVVVLDLLAS